MGKTTEELEEELEDLKNREKIIKKILSKIKGDYITNQVVEGLKESVKQLRTEKGLSQDDIANGTNFDANYISKIENEGRDLRGSSLAKLAHSLNVDMNTLFDFEIDWDGYPDKDGDSDKKE